MARLAKITTADTLQPAPPASAAERQRSPARQRLADVLGNIELRRIERVGAASGLVAADADFFKASAVRDEAEQTLERSKPRLADYTPPTPARGAFWGSAEENDEIVRRRAEAEAEPPMPISDARAALASAQDAVDTASRLRQHWRDRIHALDDRAGRDSFEIDDAVRGVVRSDAALVALAAACRQLVTRAEAAREAFRVATGGDVIQPGSAFHGCTEPARASTGPEAFADWSLSRDWRAALEALRSDPDALLPMP